MRAGMLRGVYEMVSAVVEHIIRSDMTTDEAAKALERLLPSSDQQRICPCDRLNGGIHPRHHQIAVYANG